MKYSDQYFNYTKEILKKDKYNPTVLMQIFQRQNAVVCGIKHSINLIKKYSNIKKLDIHYIPEGSLVKPWETVMTIEGPYQEFANLETMYLGLLARCTKICTNSYNLMYITSKPIMFFPARFDYHFNQELDGYAFNIAKHLTGCIGGVSTLAQCQEGEDPLGTMPHALIAAYNGDTSKAMLKYAEYIDKKIPRIALVDFNNDCVNTSLRVAAVMQSYYCKTKDKRYILNGVRLDTSGNMVDVSLISEMGEFKPTGVNEKLVWKVRHALNNNGFKDVKIYVSGGFNKDKIKKFEENEVPVDGYGVGSSMFEGNYDYTADIVKVNGELCSKVGRSYKHNKDLVKYEI